MFGFSKVFYPDNWILIGPTVAVRPQPGLDLLEQVILMTQILDLQGHDNIMVDCQDHKLHELCLRAKPLGFQCPTAEIPKDKVEGSVKSFLERIPMDQRHRCHLTLKKVFRLPQPSILEDVGDYIGFYTGPKSQIKGYPGRLERMLTRYQN